ncbi:haloacid dehalogenase-like hydrolase [Streptomyces sp. ODS28]|uniref:haloacid dehalogenase-like hydrolase n=1 Tax=Streptomyces sp. ODS28 TaxID=3136688 RepID=UPI0031EB8D70
MRSRTALVTALAAAAALAPGTAVAAGQPAQDRAPAHDAHCPQLSHHLKWHGDNRDRLQRVIDERGTCSHSFSRGEDRPVAAFDWDNTMTKNDITDATLTWALRHDKILRPAHWQKTSKWMTKDAARALTKACGTDVPVGEPLNTSDNTRCTDEIMEIRSEAKTMAGDDAFEGEWNHRRTVPEYAWIPQLFAGHTEDEVRTYASIARTEALKAPIGSKRKVGTHTVPAYVRYYEQQKDLVRTLRAAGFDVYIVSAGSEPVTEAWSPALGFDRDHTLAIRSITDKQGRMTTRTQGCGDVADGQGEAIPYRDGKRCRLNEDVFGIHGADAWKKQDPAHRIAIGGGDADTDVTFVSDATGAHEVLNRNETELMCRAYDNADGRWVVNPMFIEPKPRMKGSYPCATKGWTAPDGSEQPMHRADGSVVRDQKDTVHG